MICPNYASPSYLVFSDDMPALLYYSHISSMIVALLLGVFVYIKNKNLISGVLLALALSFSLWTFIDLVVWANIDTEILMFNYSLFGILNPTIFVLCFYFVFVFINKKDINFSLKTFFGLVISFSTVFSFKNATLFNLPICGVTGSDWYSNYFFYGVELFFSLWIIGYGVYKYFSEKTAFKKQILLLLVGMCLFLLSFFTSGFLANYFVENFNMTDYRLEFYGYFGMPIFMGFLAYLIVQYKAFNIQLLKAQALVVGLFILIGSQFFFIQNNTNRILNGITLFLAGSFGWWLVRSVKEEVKRKEQLEIISKQLANANIKLKRLDEAKTEFISIASHQLRTPLTSIKGFISLIFEGLYGKYSDQIKDVLEKVYISNERLIKLVEDLLNISRIDSGRMTFQFEKNSITEVVNEVFSTMEMVAENKKLKLEYKKPTKDIGDLIFDKVKIREVISNFVDNAIKYTQSGFVQLELKELPETVQVVVSDSGVGIDKEDIEGIFEKFRRGREIGKIHSDGAGLGLYVCLKIANAHNAKVWAESEGKGKGSRFILELRKDFEGKDKQS